MTGYQLYTRELPQQSDGSSEEISPLVIPPKGKVLTTILVTYETASVDCTGLGYPHQGLCQHASRGWAGPTNWRGNDLGCLILQGGQGMQDVTTWSCHILIIINIVSIIDQSLTQGYVKFLD